MFCQSTNDSHSILGDEPLKSETLFTAGDSASEGEQTRKRPEEYPSTMADGTGDPASGNLSPQQEGDSKGLDLAPVAGDSSQGWPGKSFPEVCPLCGSRISSEGPGGEFRSRMSLFLQKFGPAIGWIDLPSGFLLSVIIPVYNEQVTIRELVSRVEAVPIPKEIILVDDGSTDGTRQILEGWRGRPGFQILFHEMNRGKGAAIRSGLAVSRGHVVLIQDADLEYDPVHYPELIYPIVRGVADVVYGSRFLPGGPHRVLYFWHAVANGIITTLSNMFTDLNLTDVETCYKVFRGDLIRSIAPTLREEGFGFEIEVTAKVARRRCRIYEVGISYFGRTYAEGKKIRLRDAFHAVWCILRYWRWD